MPIASGAAGRVDVGVDASATWTRDGLKRGTKPPNRNCDSYLQRYQEQKKKDKSHLLQGAQNNTDQSDQNEGAKEENPLENDTSDDPTSGKPTSGKGSKKSVMCALL